MALDTTKIKLPHSVVVDMSAKVKDKSTIAALSTPIPQIFANTDHMVFTGAAEADVVAEGAKKSSYEQTLNSVEGKRVKLVTTTRVTDELKWADEDNRLEIVNAIMADQTAALARAIDYVVYHAVNPKTGSTLDGYTALTTGANSVTAGADLTADIDAMAEKLLEYEVNGFAMSRKLAFDLRKLRVPSTGMRLYPEIPMSLELGSFDGIPACTSGTVNGKKATSPTNVLGIMGNFDMIKWGMVRDIYSEIIEYGDPDQTGVDLKANNQIAYRTESMFSYAVLDPKAFTVLKNA